MSDIEDKPREKKDVTSQIVKKRFGLFKYDQGHLSINQGHLSIIVESDDRNKLEEILKWMVSEQDRVGRYYHISYSVFEL